MTKPVWIWLYQAIFAAYVMLMALFAWAMPQGHPALLIVSGALAAVSILVIVAIQLRRPWARWAALAALLIVIFTRPAVGIIQVSVFNHAEPTLGDPSPITLIGMGLLLVPLVGSSEVAAYFRPTRPTGAA